MTKGRNRKFRHLESIGMVWNKLELQIKCIYIFFAINKK